MNFKKIVFWEEIQSKEKVLELKPDLVLLNRDEEKEFRKGKIELLELVNEKEEKVLIASRRIAHKLGLYCTCVHMLVFNSNGYIGLQKRSQKMDTYPGRLTSTAAGHKGINNSTEEAAKRECLEELGFAVKQIEQLGKIKIDDPKHNQIVYVYKTVFDGKINFDEKEIEKIEYYSLEELKKISKENFTPAFQEVMKLF